MANRDLAFREWRQGIISDESLRQVIKDLTDARDILRAMDAGRLVICALTLELSSALSMQDARARILRGRPWRQQSNEK